MKPFSLFLAFYLVLLSQDTIFVYRSGLRNKVFNIEDALLTSIEESYNRKNKKPIHFEVKIADNFAQLFELSMKANEEKNYSICTMSGITITPERKKTFDFSVPYIRVQEVIFGLKSKSYPDPENIWKKKGTRIGYIKGNLEEKQIHHIKKKYPVVGIEYTQFQAKYQALMEGKIDFSLGDDLLNWVIDTLEYVSDAEVQHGDGYGIMYPKGSPLKKKLDRYIDYFIKSAVFRRALRENYGTSYSEYYRRFIEDR